MLTSRPRRPWAQQIATLLTATCLTLLTMTAAAAARTGQPTATTTSVALRGAVALRSADQRALTHSANSFKDCVRAHAGRCANQRRAVKNARARLAAANREVRSLSARISRRYKASKHAHVASPAESKSGSPSSSAGTSSGSGGSSTGESSTGETGGSPSSSSTDGAGSTGTGSTAGSTPPQEIIPPIQEPPTTGSSSFEPGLNSGSDPTYDVPGAAKLGAKLVRLDFGIEQSARSLEPIIADYAAEGIRVLPLADFYGSLPTPAEAQNLAGWAKTFGPGGTFWAHRPEGQLAIRSIEFGNETSYSYQYSNDTSSGYASRAQTYALRFVEAADAIHAANTGVGLLAQGDSGNAGSLWVENMFKAVPNLGQYVAGWTIHPYGPGWRPRVEALVRETAAQGAPSNIPVDITEWGLSTDNGRCLSENYDWNKCMTYQEAGEALTRTVSEMRQTLGSRMGMFLLYQVRDKVATGTSTEREEYFGALQHELQPKGAYTAAAEALLAS
jgi:hypothetical protein